MFIFARLIYETLSGRGVQLLEQCIARRNPRQHCQPRRFYLAIVAIFEQKPTIRQRSPPTGVLLRERVDRNILIFQRRQITQLAAMNLPRINQHAQRFGVAFRVADCRQHIRADPVTWVG